MKKWTIKNAWSAKNGSSKPVSHEEIKASDITEIDRLIASSLGLRDQQSMKKIHAALSYAMPLLTTHQLPPATTRQKSLRHAAKHAIACVMAYCKADGIPKSEYRFAIDALKNLDFTQLTQGDWFLIWDAMGTEGEIKDQECYDFYRHAGQCWHYATLAEME
jgi:hypothetical protein